MHRHGYQGKKFGRETDQREALIKSLADSLVLEESVETTLPKAKELRRYLEKLITKAKKGGLHNRRQVIKGLHTVEAAHKLVDELAPKLTGRNSGHLSIKRSIVRRGDNAQLAVVSFVDDLSVELKPAKKAEPKPAAKKPVVKKESAKKSIAKRVPRKAEAKK
jgi:large subunit ribosomal protein L17